MAQTGPKLMHRTCLLLGVKRTWLSHREMSAFEPKADIVRLLGLIANLLAGFVVVTVFEFLRPPHALICESSRLPGCDRVA
jgi:hypothetical protein